MPARPRPSTATIKADRVAVEALTQLEEYKSFDPAFELAVVQEHLAALDACEAAETQALTTLADARTRKTEAACALHDAVGGVKLQILAQFGPDSPAVRAFGLTRRSDRRHRTR